MNILATMAAVLTLSSAAAGNSGLQARLDISLREAPLNWFLDDVSAGAKLNFILGGDYSDKKITASLHDVAAGEALKLLDAQGLGYRRVGASNTFLVADKGSKALQAPTTVEAGPALDRLVTIRLKGAPLSELAAVLSSQTKTPFALASGLQDKRITVFLNNVTVREALDVLGSLKGLSVRRLSAGPESYSIEPAS